MSCGALRRARRGLSGLSGAQVRALDAQCVLGTYARQPLTLVRGQGTRVWDAEGKEYLDFASGIAVNCLGHSDPGWVDAITSQAKQLAHVSNLYHTEPQVRVAQRLLELAPGMARVFLCNSGTEASEAAVKFARRAYYEEKTGTQPRPRFVSFAGAFHGRSMGALALTPKKAIQQQFAPLGLGEGNCLVAPYGDIEAAVKLVDRTVAAVAVEAVQGEGGVRTASHEFLRALREACDRSGTLLIFDEVQCGLGRTGMPWGFSGSGVVPDMITLAKPLAGGLPMGAVLVNACVAGCIKPGDHGSTFAGNPLASAAALYVMERLFGPPGSDPVSGGLMPAVRERGQLLVSLMRSELVARHPAKALEVRHGAGRGLIISLRLAEDALPAAKFQEAALRHGLLLPTAGDNTVRWLPPLNVSEVEVREAVRRASEALASC